MGVGRRAQLQENSRWKAEFKVDVEAKGKMDSSNTNMARDDDAASGNVEASATFMGGGIA
jgi:hypothetical protein